MKCPKDDTVLVMTERSGVEIDYCPTCRGVWLDRGELDKILDRAAATSPVALAEPARAQAPRSTEAPGFAPQFDQRRDERPREQDSRYRDDRYRDDHHGDGYRRPHKRRESFLSDLFDF